MAERVSISSSILEWAITRAGYDLSQYLAHYPQVEEWIKGDKQPTIKQVEMLVENPLESGPLFPHIADPR